jgi:hypothetical protein
VVVVFYVPISDHDYFKDMSQVLDRCLLSLISTINPETTAITLINNNSAPIVNAIVEKYLPRIDKYVIYSENKGKVYAALNEVRGINEEFVTIADSDILFFPGWEKAVFDIFISHPRAGVVSPYPSPYTAFYHNKPVFGINSLSNNIGFGKYVADYDIDLYISGTNLPNLIKRKYRSNWKEKQYILKNPSPAVIGAYHVVSTYRSEQFRNTYNFPEVKFSNSYEELFIDCQAAKRGMYRLSTLKSYAYHMGNTPEDLIPEAQDTGHVTKDFFAQIKPLQTQPQWLILILSTIGRIYIKFKWNY